MIPEILERLIAHCFPARFLLLCCGSLQNWSFFSNFKPILFWECYWFVFTFLITRSIWKFYLYCVHIFSIILFSDNLVFPQDERRSLILLTNRTELVISRKGENRSWNWPWELTMNTWRDVDNDIKRDVTGHQTLDLAKRNKIKNTNNAPASSKNERSGAD